MKNAIRILIIEDDESIRISLKEILESESFIAQTAENGLSGLLHLKESKENPPSLIIMDLYMPVMDGKTFLKEFKLRFPEQQQIPVLIMTAAAPSDFPRDFDPAMIIRKPIDIDDMLDKISFAVRS